MLSKIKNKSDIGTLFPKTKDEIETLVKNYIAQAQAKVDTIISIDPDKRTFKNTAKALDEISSLDNISVLYSSISALEMLSPEKEIRDAAHKSLLEIQKFWVDQISNNVKLYKAFKAYAHGNAKQETLTEEEKYFISETLQDYKRSGLDLPEEQLEKVKTLQKELGRLGLTFEANIAQDKSSIIVPEQALAGVDKTFIQGLEKTENGNYILRMDYPTYFTIMDNCHIEETRKKLYLAFNNRAYPANEAILKQIIEKRDELAKMLGFASYAHLDLDDQMAQTPQKAESFLSRLHKKASTKAQNEFDLLCKNLPNSVQLTEDKKIKAWDARYIKNLYKKKHLQVDEQKIAEYFPAEKTIAKLLTTYEQFLSLRFEISPTENIWHEDTKLIEIYDAKNNELLGYLILDLHPRENKYSHACQMTIVPAVKDHGPSVCIVVANFPKSTKEKPSLLKLDDVETFFHELGHALHAILGRTRLGSFSGTSVKTDFVEMPSQMFEEWLSDKQMLKKISSHYKTGQHLPEETIDNILRLKQFDSGDFLQRQCYLSCLALAYFKEGKDKNPKEIYQALTNHMRTNIAYDKDDNMYAAFGHLSGYGAKYYSYMWSKVFAIDMFAKIKEHGLLNPDIGKKYIDGVIGKGGSKDPNILLRDFLGRNPNETAFFQNLGLL